VFYANSIFERFSGALTQHPLFLSVSNTIFERSENGLFQEFCQLLQRFAFLNAEQNNNTPSVCAVYREQI
jgi:hypothetical protein